MALAAGWMVGGGLEPSADSDGTRRPEAASNPDRHTARGFYAGRLVGRPGLELGERLRLVVVAETVGRVEVGLRPPAGSDKTPRPKGASNPGPPD